MNWKSGGRYTRENGDYKYELHPPPQQQTVAAAPLRLRPLRGLVQGLLRPVHGRGRWGCDVGLRAEDAAAEYECVLWAGDYGVEV